MARRGGGGGCHSLSDVAARGSLEQHAGPIDALAQDAGLLAEYNRWLMQAAKRAEYLQERARETQRQQAVASQKVQHAQRGSELQRAAWQQRGRAVEEKQKLVRINQQKARVGKHEAAVRHQTKQMRDAAWDHYTAMVHSEVADVPAEVRQAKAALLGAKHAGAQTIKAATGAIERRKTALQEQREAEARALRDRVRASQMVSVPAELAAHINGGLSGSFREARPLAPVACAAESALGAQSRPRRASPTHAEDVRVLVVAFRSGSACLDVRHVRWLMHGLMRDGVWALRRV